MPTATVVPAAPAPVLNPASVNQAFAVPAKPILTVTMPVLVDPERAYSAAIESTTSPVNAMLELYSNSKDYATEITITLYGDWVKNSRDILLKRVVFEDNGIGMDHATVCEKFRGGWFDSPAHDDAEKSGRNGVGVKTNFKYWKTIKVESSTNGFIPQTWQCKDANRPGVEDSFVAASKLKKGDQDTELRKYVMTRASMTIIEFAKCPHIYSGTKVELENPIGGSVKIDFDELLSRMSHSIEFLDKDRHPSHKVTINYKKPDTGTMTSIIVRPFYEMEHKNPGSTCEAVGTNKRNLKVTAARFDSITVDKVDDPDLGEIEINLQVLKDSTQETRRDFVISVCGSNLYDEYSQRSGLSMSVSKLLNMWNFSSPGSFGHRLYGYIRTNNPKLKRALRFNRTALDEHDPAVVKFWDYIGKVLKALNHQFINANEADQDEADAKALVAIKEELRETIKIGGRIKQKVNGAEQSESLNHLWVCENCGCIWRAPKALKPQYCCDGSVTGKSIEGKDSCGSDRVVRKANTGLEPKLTGTISESIDVKWVNTLGGFVPARYEEAEHRVELARLHPDFILSAGTKKEAQERVVRGVERSLFAIATTLSTKEHHSVEEAYATLLRNHFWSSASSAHKSACRVMWEKEGVSEYNVQ